MSSHSIPLPCELPSRTTPRRDLRLYSKNEFGDCNGLWLYPPRPGPRVEREPKIWLSRGVLASSVKRATRAVASFLL